MSMHVRPRGLPTTTKPLLEQIPNRTKLQATCRALVALTGHVKSPEPAAQAHCLSLACCPQRDAREVALRESWARERDAALDREQSAASTRIRDLSNR